MSIAEVPDMFGPSIVAGGYRAWLAGPADMPDVMALRARAFRAGRDDGDRHDAGALHLCVGPLQAPACATVRIAVHAGAASLLQGYAAQSYDLRPMARLPGVVLELGRLCAEGKGDALRLLWGGVARLAATCEAQRLIGCTSFPTTRPAEIASILARLARDHVGPEASRPLPRAPETRRLEDFRGDGDTAGDAELPALLRFYLMLGGWVSDHLVIDRDLGTCHVFTCVDVKTIPEGRRRTLSRIAQRDV